MRVDDLEFELSDVEQASLVSIMEHPGFKAGKKLLMGIVHALRVDVDNATTDQEVLSKQKLSRAASLVFARWTQELSALEVQISNRPRVSDPIVDKTDLDLDSIEHITKDMPNFFGDAELPEEE
jgi:hypothetical protein